MVSFGAAFRLTPVSIRRAAAALRFAEQLAQAKIVLVPEELAGVRLEALDSLKRIHGYGLRGLEEVRSLLPKVREGTLVGAALRGEEARFRKEEDTRARRDRTNSLELRLRTPAFRTAGLAALNARAGSEGARFWALEAGSKALMPMSVDGIVQAIGGRLRGCRLLPAASSGRESRLNDAVLLALAGARVFDEFELVAQATEDGSNLAAKVRELGIGSGVAVSWIAPGPRAELVQRVLAGDRLAAPDLRSRYVDRLMTILSRPIAASTKGRKREAGQAIQVTGNQSRKAGQSGPDTIRPARARRRSA